MRKIALCGKAGEGKFALVDVEDYEWASKRRWYLNGGYAVVSVSDQKLLLHRLVNKTPKGFETDHINHNKLDNRRKNLRTATKSQNQQNRKGANKNNTSGQRGVVYIEKLPRPWMARTVVKSKVVCFGYYTTFEAAARAARNGIHKLNGSIVRV